MAMDAAGSSGHRRPQQGCAGAFPQRTDAQKDHPLRRSAVRQQRLWLRYRRCALRLFSKHSCSKVCIRKSKVLYLYWDHSRTLKTSNRREAQLHCRSRAVELTQEPLLGAACGPQSREVKSAAPKVPISPWLTRHTGCRCRFARSTIRCHEEDKERQDTGDKIRW